MSETYAADTWLYGKLHGDATLLTLISGVYADVAPLDAVFPVLVYSLQEGGDLTTINGVRIWMAATYEVQIVTDATSFGAIKTAVDRVDALLHRASGSVSGGVVYSCVREAPLRFTEHIAGKVYRHMGGFYRLHVQ